MTTYKCQWCGNNYDFWKATHNEQIMFCSEKCRYEARSSGWKSNNEKTTERFYESLASLPPTSKEEKAWDDARNMVTLPTLLISALMTIAFMRTGFPALFPGLAYLILSKNSVRTIFPNTEGEWVATICMCLIPIPVGWAAWIFFSVAAPINANVLAFVVKNVKK
jgi:hypothetical protein